MIERILNKVKEISDNYGKAMVGAGLGAVGIGLVSIAGAVNNVVDRFDRVEEMVVEVKEGAQAVTAAQAGLKEDLTTLRAQLPALGNEFGDAAANAAQTLEERLGCTEDNKADCETGVRGKVLQGLDKLKPGK